MIVMTIVLCTQIVSNELIAPGALGDGAQASVKQSVRVLCLLIDNLLKIHDNQGLF